MGPSTPIAKLKKRNVEWTPRKKHEIMNRCAFYMNKDDKGEYKIVYGGVSLIQKDFQKDTGIKVSGRTVKVVISTNRPTMAANLGLWKPELQ